MTEYRDPESYPVVGCGVGALSYVVSIYPDEVLRDELVGLSANLVWPAHPTAIDPLADFASDDQREEFLSMKEASGHVTHHEALVAIENRMLELLHPTRLRFHLIPAEPTELASGRPVVDIAPLFANEVTLDDAAAIVDAYKVAHADVVAALRALRRAAGLA